MSFRPLARNFHRPARSFSRPAVTARPRLRRAWPAVLLALLAALITAAALPRAAGAGAPVRSYRGLGIWVDIYDRAAWDDPAAAVADMDQHGVRTLFLETSNYHWPTAINRRAAMSALIQECHARGIKVVGWYVPGFRDLAKDFRRSRAAIRYRTANGQKFDSFALDIETSIVKNVDKRTRRLKALSSRIRKAVGGKYPLGAIIPSPAGMRMHASYWPGFPYKTLAKVYDVFVPMGYYTYHGDGYTNAYRDTRNNVLIIREETGRPSIPIHVIAGIANKSSGTETTAYVRALRETGCLGGSMYDWATTNQKDWDALQDVRVNPRQTPSLPVAVGFVDPLGYCGADRAHPKEVFFEAEKQDGDRVLSYRLYDAQTDEVHLLVNWQDLGALPEGSAKAWTGVRQVTIPAAGLSATGRNVIGFVAAGDYPQWSTWGVRDVTLGTP